MNFEVGDTYGRFFWSILSEYEFFGIAIRIGVEEIDEEVERVFHISLMLGYIQLTLGVVLD